jgi:hypothetical protein
VLVVAGWRFFITAVWINCRRAVFCPSIEQLVPAFNNLRTAASAAYDWPETEEAFTADVVT